MNQRTIAGAGFVTVTLGAVGCGEPARPAALDAAALFPPGARRSGPGEAWRNYLEPAALHAAWAPSASGPWRPYYRPTLAAAVALVKEAAWPSRGGRDPRADDFAGRADLEGAAVFLDLPGEESVGWAMALAPKGFQPVLTFNNWPHQQGILRLEKPLGALLAHAEAAAALPRDGAARPVFVLEGTRLARKEIAPRSGEFDNRYFHAPSDFPSAAVLKGRGISKVFYVNPRGVQAGAEEDDLNAYFLGLHEGGIRLVYAARGSDGSLLVQDSYPTRKATIFSAAHTDRYLANPTSPSHRSYPHFHHHHGFWNRSSGTWGSDWSGGGGSSGWST